MEKETDSQLTAGQCLPAPLSSPVASHQGTSIRSDENGPRVQGQPFKAAEVTAEQWWARHAALLAEKMKFGGVQDFRVYLTDRGTYEFEVNPIQENTTTMAGDEIALPSVDGSMAEFPTDDENTI